MQNLDDTCRRLNQQTDNLGQVQSVPVCPANGASGIFDNAIGAITERILAPPAPSNPQATALSIAQDIAKLGVQTALGIILIGVSPEAAGVAATMLAIYKGYCLGLGLLESSKIICNIGEQQRA